MNKAIEWLASNQDAIQAEWKGWLAMKLREEGRNPPGIPDDLIPSTFFQLLKYLRDQKHREPPEPVPPAFEELLRGFSSRLIHHLEIFLIGEEVLENLLIERGSSIKSEDLTKLLELIDLTHQFFHHLILRKTKSYCGKCVEPSEEILKYLIQHRHTPPLNSNPL